MYPYKCVDRDRRNIRSQIYILSLKWASLHKISLSDVYAQKEKEKYFTYYLGLDFKLYFSSLMYCWDTKTKNSFAIAGGRSTVVNKIRLDSLPYPSSPLNSRTNHRLYLMESLIRPSYAVAVRYPLGQMQ